ncbi:MAG: glycerophosphodiester phosphodiesterase [Anaerolineaceae bacterium]|nr:MAG: glycerophosphodiester phosphodiesterase [Anaerolineaceae bacterium]
MFVELCILLGVLILLYLLAIMPKLRKNPNRIKFEGWYYAHRGIHDNKHLAPENSLEAFRLAVESGYGIELDVQVTKDLVPVVFHDYNLHRACGVNKKVSELDYEELLQYKLFKSQERIPTLREVLDIIEGKVPIIVELKIPWKPDDTCMAASEELKDYSGLYCIESFNPFGLGWYKKHHPEIIRGQLSTDFAKEKIEGSKMQYFILKHLLFNFHTKPDFIAYQHKYKKGLSFTICRKLYRAWSVAWTIKSQEDLENSKDYYDLFIFENFSPQK